MARTENEVRRLSYARLNRKLFAVFNRMTRNDPSILDSIPNNPVFIVNIRGFDEFNTWAEKAAHYNLERSENLDRRKVYIVFPEEVLPPSKQEERDISTESVMDFELEPQPA